MINDKKLYYALKELQILDIRELDKAFLSAQNQKKTLSEILLRNNLIAEEDLAKLNADTLSYQYVNLITTVIPKQILELLPEEIARQERVIVFKKDVKGLHIAMENPDDKEFVTKLQQKFGVPIVVYLSSKKGIDKSLALYLKDIEKAFEDIIQESVQQARGVKEATSVEPPVIKIVDTIIQYGYENNASDIHIEPEKLTALIRFRIDGVLRDILRVTLDVYPQILTRVKVMAKLRTDEHLTPQDGKISYTVNGNQLDIRVSSVPVARGEKLVLRLLSDHERSLSLRELGLSERDLGKITNAYEKPFGMILATGPTGSGKTTTMYAILKLLNQREVNIMTIEDPVEYELEGVNQIQVNQKANLTFATGLRSILRQDPNIILVGEVRDEETADIAVNASMTGHLVLSTLHSNDAPTALPRLIEMAIEPFLIASTVSVIVAQRLVRKIHNACRVSQVYQTAMIRKFFDKSIIDAYFGTAATVRLYKGKGCLLCHNTGFEGRIGIFEVLEINEQLKQAIVDKEDATTIRKLAMEANMQSMVENGLEKAKEGETTLEEVLRVIKT